MTGENADGWRDALAILAASLAGDYEGVGTVLACAGVPAVTGALAAMLFEALRERGTDPAEWVAGQQARARDELCG